MPVIVAVEIDDQYLFGRLSRGKRAHEPLITAVRENNDADRNTAGFHDFCLSVCSIPIKMRGMVTRRAVSTPITAPNKCAWLPHQKTRTTIRPKAVLK